MRAIVKFSILGSFAAVSAVIAVAAAALPTAAASDASRRPAVTLVSESPLTVAGRGFARMERVTLRTSVNGTRFAKTLRASPGGRFTATFAEASVQPCDPFIVSAVGRAGSRATLRRIEIPPACGVVLQP